MSQATSGNKVKVHYTGRLKDGTTFDSSQGRDPLELSLGEGQVIPGFEQAIMGMEVNQTKTVEIPVDQAYGPKRDEMILEVERSKLPEDLKPEVGQHLQIPQPQGQPATVKVTEITEEKITLDGNHPLAGEDLIFDIELVEIT